MEIQNNQIGIEIEGPEIEAERKEANFRKYYIVSKINLLSAIIVLVVIIMVRRLSTETEVAGKYVDIVAHKGSLYLDGGSFIVFLYGSLFSIMV